MKTRSGFVSNSSSSSFIIGVKKEVLQDEELLVSKLLEIFEITRTSPFFSLLTDVVSYLKNSTYYRTKEEYFEFLKQDLYLTDKSEEEVLEELKEWYSQQFDIYQRFDELGLVITERTMDYHEEDYQVFSKITCEKEDLMIINLGE